MRSFQVCIGWRSQNEFQRNSRLSSKTRRTTQSRTAVPRSAGTSSNPVGVFVENHSSWPTGNKIADDRIRPVVMATQNLGSFLCSRVQVFSIFELLPKSSQK